MGLVLQLLHEVEQGARFLALKGFSEVPEPLLDGGATGGRRRCDETSPLL